MSKTYEALKKAEAEKARKLHPGEESPASGDAAPSPVPVITRTESPSPAPSPAPKAAPTAPTGRPREEQVPTPPSGRGDANGHSFPPPLNDRSLSPNLEAQYQRLFASLVIQGQQSTPFKTLMVVGADHGDGVTTSASLFARALAKSRTVLLVDANLRTPALAEIFHVRSHGGFSDFLARKVSLDGVITPTEDPNLFIMTSGSAALAPPYIFEGGAFDELLAGLKERFDYIIFDAAPVGLHLDSVFLASRVDGVILVIKAETTQVDVGLSIKKRLEEVGARFLGVVVNQTQNYVPKALRRVLS